MKNQYSMASAYPLRDSEPRFLALDAFKLHINKGKKVKDKEIGRERAKRLKEEKL